LSEAGSATAYFGTLKEFSISDSPTVLGWWSLYTDGTTALKVSGLDSQQIIPPFVHLTDPEVKGGTDSV